MRVAAAFVIAALAPLAFAPGGEAVHFMVLCAAYVIMALGLNVVVGFAGLLDLGYVAFFAIGAHVAAHFGSSFWVPGIHLSFLLILVLAIVATGIAGVLIGVPTLRLRGDYVGMVTLAFGEIIGQVVVNGREIRFLGGSLTGGPNGISGLDRIDLPLLPAFGRLDLRPWYWLALALVGLVLIANVHLRDSRPGRAWRALRDDEQAAAAAGIPIARTKLLAYGVGAALGGIAGAFLATYLGFVNPGQFTFSFSIFILAMVVLGGLGSIEGVVVGAIVLTLFNHYVLPRLLTDFAEVASGIYGLLLVLVILVRPDGLHPISLKTSRLH